MRIQRHARQGDAQQGQGQADGEGMLARAEQVLDAGHELASMGGVRECMISPESTWRMLANPSRAVWMR